MPVMTLRRLAPLINHARRKKATDQDREKASAAIALRAMQRGPSKLARRLRRKRELGLAGAF